MKKKIAFWTSSAVLLAFMVLLVNNCKDDSPTVSCQDGTNECGTFTACCSTTQCYYKWNGNKYNCDGTDCYAAAQDLVADMCAAKSPAVSIEQMLEITNKLVDSNGGCKTCNK